MSTAVSVAGWAAAVVAAALAMTVRRAYGARMEAVVRACHELRGPLTAARLGLAPPAGQEVPSPRRLRAVDAELGRATLALDDLAGTGAGAGACPGGGDGRRWDVDRVDVEALVTDSVEAWQAAATAAGTELRGVWCGGEAVVWGDRLRLAQAIGNLIANAIEHGRGPVEVRGAQRAGRVRIVISDAGRGLPAPVAELIDRPRRGRGARGRGLAISAEVAQVHRGWLASAPSESGARLLLDLPVADRGPNPAG
ncbi:MAG: sensor histidine kinase [Solirubrobacteraceae bacterium]